MTDGSPQVLLGEVENLRRITRARVHGAALPLAVFGLLTLASTLLYRAPFQYGIEQNVQSDYTLVPLERTDRISGYAGLYWSDRSGALSVTFWLIATPLCYLGCAWWYRRRAERIGLAMSWQRWAYVGVALMGVVLTTLAIRSEALTSGSLDGPTGQFEPIWALNPLLAVFLGLLMLARVERSPGTLAIALCYGALAFLLSAFPQMRPIPVLSEDAFVAPGAGLVTLASVLLVGAAALWLRTSSERRRS